jgi:hypothetical protein
VRDRPGCLTYVAFYSAGVGAVVVVPAMWISIGVTYRRAGAMPAIAVALASGAVGWWILFRVCEPHLERLAERWFGPKDEAASRGLAAQLTWQRFSPSMKTWARIVYAFVVLAPIVQILCHEL